MVRLCNWLTTHVGPTASASDKMASVAADFTRLAVSRSTISPKARVAERRDTKGAARTTAAMASMDFAITCKAWSGK
eukprot:scaffold321766_cov27-Tisochrysis_lutea.AAC.2